uniref:C-type lectin domain-containing protein n=1 Tax=Panagrolaimus sp. ES5 TaxID=591445 RepID=A0AC34FZ69_9BILA
MAEKFCNNLGGNLVSIHDAFVNAVVTYDSFNLLNRTLLPEFWIGAMQNSNDGSWGWTDGSSFDFTDWKKGEPKNSSSISKSCALLSTNDGYWSAQDCTKSKPFTCRIPLFIPTTTRPPRSCPADYWTFFNETGYCYNLEEFGNHTNGEKICQKDGGHLASIHSKAENDFVGNLNHISGPFHQTLYAFIGLIRTNSTSAGWKWTDGTPFDYVNWQRNEPLNGPDQNCVIQMSDSPFGYAVTKCDDNRGFICKTLPTP